VDRPQQLETHDNWIVLAFCDDGSGVSGILKTIAVMVSHSTISLIQCPTYQLWQR
jgi:hypothetical protein